MIKKASAAVLLIIFLSFGVFAYEGTDVKEYITKEMQDNLPEDILSEDNDGGQIINYKSIIAYLCEKGSQLVMPVVKNFFSILGVVVMSAVFGTMSRTLQSETTRKTFGYIISICIAVLLYRILEEQWKNLSVLLDDINVFMNGVTPVTTLLYALGGNVTTSAVSESAMGIILTVFGDICYYGIKPVLQICFGFSVVSCVSGSVDLKPIAKFVRTAYTTILVFVISFMTCVMSLQNMLTTANDSLALRTVKFASASAVPIVGSALGEASATVASGIGVIKSAFGVLAIIAILLMVAPCIFSLWMNKLAFSLGGAACSVFGLQDEGELISSAGELLNFALAITISVSAMFIINISLFCKAACALGG